MGMTRRSAAAGIALVLGTASASPPPATPRQFRRPRPGAALTPEEFGAVGDGQHNDLDAWRRLWAARAGRVVRCSPGARYWLGDITNAQPLLLADGGTVHIDGQGARIEVRTSFEGAGAPLTINSPEEVEIANLRFTDRGFDPFKTWRGSHFALFNAGLAGDSGSITVRDCAVEGALSFMTATSGNSPRRLRGIRLLGRNVARRCYYGLNMQAQGDALEGRLECIDVRRAYISYGCRDHDLDLNVTTSDALFPGSNGAMVVASITSPENLRSASESIRLRATMDGLLNRYGSLVLFQLQSDTGEAFIDDVDVTLDIGPSGRALATMPFKIGGYDLKSHERRRALGRIDRLTLGGDALDRTSPLASPVDLPRRGRLTLRRDRPVLLSDDIRRNFAVSLQPPM